MSFLCDNFNKTIKKYKIFLTVSGFVKREETIENEDKESNDLICHADQWICKRTGGGQKAFQY